MSSDDKHGSGKPGDVQVSDPDLSGLSSVFSTTRSGLKPLRRRARPTGETEAVDPTPATPAEGGDEDTGTGGDDDYETVEESPIPPRPDDAALDVPEPGVTPAVDGIQLRPGLALVDTAEIPAHRPPPAEADEPEAPPPAESPPAEPPPAGASPATPAVPAPTPPRVPPPRKPPTHPPAALFDDEPSSARRDDARPVRTSSNWVLYVVVMILAVCLIGALLITVREL